MIRDHIRSFMAQPRPITPSPLPMAGPPQLLQAQPGQAEATGNGGLMGRVFPQGQTTEGDVAAAGGAQQGGGVDAKTIMSLIKMFMGG